MNLNTIYEILDKDQQDLTDQDIINVVTYNFYDDIDESIDLDEYRNIENYIMGIIENRYEEWSGYDEHYPDNTYDWGYVIAGQQITFGHHGVGGEYWNTNGNLSIAY